jgi:hypothetical protein
MLLAALGGARNWTKAATNPDSELSSPQCPAVLTHISRCAARLKNGI